MSDAGSSLRGEAKRLSLVDAAMRVFLELGYDAASMDAVAAAAGASKRTLYNYFPTKRDLFRAAAAQLYARVSADVDDPDDAQRDPAAVLTRIGRAVAAHLRRPETRGFVRLVIAASPQDPSLGEAVMKDGKGQIVAALERRFRTWRDEGRLSLNDPTQAALLFLGGLKECCFWPAMLGLPAMDEDAAVDAAVAWCLRACAVHSKC